MTRPVRTAYATAIAALAGTLMVGSGAWAFAAPRSFYEVIATFPPYNGHFLRDIGAFLVGLGIALIASTRWPDALFVAVLGGTVGNAMHTVSHVIDRHHGGNGTDPWLLGAITLLLLVAVVFRAPARRGTSERAPVRQDAGGPAPEFANGGEVR